MQYRKKTQQNKTAHDHGLDLKYISANPSDYTPF